MKKIMTVLFLVAATKNFCMKTPTENDVVRFAHHNVRQLQSNMPLIEVQVHVRSTLPDPSTITLEKEFDKYSADYSENNSVVVGNWKDLISEKATKDPLHPCHTQYAQSLVGSDWKNLAEPLHNAVLNNDIVKAYVLIKAGAYKYGAVDNPMHVAAAHGHVEMIEFLHSIGSYVDTYFQHETVLYRAVLNDQLRSVKTLIQLGADVNEGSDNFKPLLLAASNGNSEIVKYLIGLRKYNRPMVNINQRDNAGWTALSHASREGHLDVVKVLVEEGDGICINPGGGIQGTPLDLAKEKGHTQIAEYLQEKINYVLDTLSESIRLVEQAQSKESGK